MIVSINPNPMNTGTPFIALASEACAEVSPQEMQQRRVAAAQGARASAPMVHVTTFINEEHSYV
jgi:hypothetical protein